MCVCVCVCVWGDVSLTLVSFLEISLGSDLHQSSIKNIFLIANRASPFSCE